MNVQQRRDGSADEGAVLVLAVLFLTVVGLIGGAIVGLAGSNLTSTQALTQERASSYAAESAINVAIDNLRGGSDPTTTPGYVPGAHQSDCPTVTVPIPGATNPVTVMCGIGTAPLAWERTIVFAACPSAANCMSGQSSFKPIAGSAAVASVSTLFDDLRSGCNGHTTSDTCFEAGNAVNVSAFKLSEGVH